MKRRELLFTLTCLASAAGMALCWLTDWPLGIVGEWTWKRFAVTPDLTANLILGTACGVGYTAFACAGFHRLQTANPRRREVCGWLSGLVVFGLVWIPLAAGTGTSGASISRIPFVLFYPSTSGYFYKARHQEPNPRLLLRNYETLMKEGDVLHVGTHPPGLFLLFHGLIGGVERLPGTVPWINASQPEAVRSAFDVLAESLQQPGVVQPTPFTDRDRAVLWLAALLVLGMAAVTVIPIYGFVRHYADRPTSWLCAASWPLVPAIAVFLPKSDVAYAGLAMLTSWLWIAAWRKNSLGLSGLTAVVWSASLLCSLAFLPVALWLALLSLFESWPAIRNRQGTAELRRAATTISAAAFVSLSVFGLLTVWGDIPLGKIFWLNYRNHAGFYAQYARTYWCWLLENPPELMLALGAPVFVWSLAGIWSAVRFRPDHANNLFRAPCLATLITWSWLWLSGKNSGESARLWIFLMPYFVCCSGACWLEFFRDLPAARKLRLVGLWLGLQAIVCLLTAQRVSGFLEFA